MQKLIYIVLFSLITLTGWSQITADVDRGCIPLEVNFTGPTLSNYFWDFGDSSGNSALATPTRIFDMPGVYTVELFEGVGGASKGTVDITVYADPVIMFTVDDDIQEGCAPFFVQFTNESEVDPAVPITGFSWSFGDGSTSNLENPTHIYNAEGIYPITLEIFSSLPECGNVMTFNNYITVSGTVAAGFITDAIEMCDAPATFTLTNNTPNDPAYTYLWEFGDGTTSTDREPGSVTYNSKGTYTVRLIVDNGDGCKVTRERTLKVGGPDILLGIPDTICLNGITLLVNNTDAAIFEWTFSGNVFPASSTERKPKITYFTAGSQLFSLKATSSSGCISDTVFNVFVQDPDASFTAVPPATCDDPATFTLIANNPNHQAYFWNGQQGGNQFSFSYDDPERDSFYINRPDTFFYNLVINSYAGCASITDSFVIFLDIEAHAIPDVSRGCAPLTVLFEQDSKSIEPIIRYDWNFGDGSTLTDNTGDNQSHTFTDPGEYYVKLIVENDNGCIDTSTGIWIYVGEPLSSNFTIDKTTICLFDTVALEATNLDDRIDAWHFETDNGRNGHCYIDPSTNHAFVTSPGTYPVTLELEYNGCFNKIAAGTIEVEGTKALIQYMMNCDDTHTVMLQDSSFGATNTVWTIEGNTFNTEDLPDSILNYTFVDTGIYKIYLEAFDADSSCPSNIDSVEVHIVDIHADFTIDSIFCEGIPILLDASASVGVDDRCYKGYTWYLPSNRPRRVGDPTIMQAFFSPNGDDKHRDIRLEVEDINGCVDDTILTVEIFDIDAEFSFGSDRICFPSDVTLTDMSLSDTTITSWTWSTTSTNDSLVTYLATQGTTDTTYVVQLVVKDALGCVDTLEKELEVYEISSIPTLFPNPVCIGDTITLSATDYTEDGSFLNFNWTVEGNGSSMNQTFPLVINTPGAYNAFLNIEEDASGCTNDYGPLLINVVDFPEAAFVIADPAPPSPICIGDVVTFDNQSTIDGGGTYFWDFGNGAPISNVEDPSIGYPQRGTFTVTLIAQSSAGCADTVSTQLTTTGPEGEFTIDNNMICRNGDVTFTLVNPSGVESFTWDFGDGNTTDNQNPVVHTYDLLGQTTAFIRAKLILRGDDMTCEIIKDINIEINDLNAGFTYEIDSTFCPPRLKMTDLSSTTFTSKTFTVSDGQTFNDMPDVLIFNSDGQYILTQSIEDTNSGCSDVFTDTVDIVTPVFTAFFQMELTEDKCFGQYTLTNLSIPLGFIPIFFGQPDRNPIPLVDSILNVPPNSSSVLLSAFSSVDTNCHAEFIVETDPFSLVVPNLFTPNKTIGNNDLFRVINPSNKLNNEYIVDECLKICSMEVFDKFGNTVFSTTDPNTEGWDGTIGGSRAPADVYLYVIDAFYYTGDSLETFDCTSEENSTSIIPFKGNLMLVD